ncbi:hypothetical protein SASPL_127166 [Salvia splendens]|uniref:Uncharacterized protein n=1 Tax=Salvia splendens TaxID=180675 RepID=A0A8X8XKW8_SALSN|nr:hypothetical protein SASPL_127166 [Salvia splendens]
MAPLPGKRGEAGVVTTRYLATLAATAAAEQLTSEEEGEQKVPPQPPPLEQTKAEMALVDNDSGIDSLHAHEEKEPTHAIAITPGMRTIAIKSGVLAVLSHVYGLSKECPYSFLEEFCRYCDIQPVPAGSTSDYRLKAIPFVLKGDAGCRRQVPSKERLQKPDMSMTNPSANTGIDFKGYLKHAPTTKWEKRRSTQPSTEDSLWIARTI